MFSGGSKLIPFDEIRDSTFPYIDADAKVVGPEGAAAGLMGPADIVTRDILDALDLITNPLRLKATLRD